MINKKYNIYYYQTSDNKCPVKEFIDSNDKREQQKIMAWITLLSENGTLLPRPYADYLKDDIYELRIKLSGNQYRILYFFVFKDNIVLTHVFEKKTNKVPEKEINRAKEYKFNFFQKIEKKEDINYDKF